MSQKKAWFMVIVAASLAYVLVLLAWQEERSLAKRFGAEYDTYRQSTPFMLPFVPKRGVLLGDGSDREIAALVGLYVVGVALIVGLFYFFSVQ